MPAGSGAAPPPPPPPRPRRPPARAHGWPVEPEDLELAAKRVDPSRPQGASTARLTFRPSAMELGMEEAWQTPCEETEPGKLLGEVVLDLDIDDSGMPRDVRIVRGPGEVGPMALEFASRHGFDPAIDAEQYRRAETLRMRYAVAWGPVLEPVNREVTQLDPETVPMYVPVPNWPGLGAVGFLIDLISMGSEETITTVSYEFQGHCAPIFF